MSNILVTGGAGFIGSNLTEALLQQGHTVRVLDNFSTGKRENIVFDKDNGLLQVIMGDIRDQDICLKAADGVDYLFHQAALASVPQSVEDPVTSNSVNVGGTLNLLWAAKERRVKRFIYASSCAIYGDDPSLPKKEDMAPAPLSPYALQKYIGERYCSLFSQLYGLETVCLRYFNVFGPKQDPGSIYSAVIPRFIDAFLEGHPPTVYGDGEQSRDFVYIENLVEANLHAMSASSFNGEVINIGCGKSTSLNLLLRILQKVMGSTLGPAYEKPRPGDITRSYGDIGKANRMLNYFPRVELEEGLRQTVSFLRKMRFKDGVR